MSQPNDETLDAALTQLYATALSRRGADPTSSYTASLFAKGLDTMLKKVGEEATETVIAAKNDDPQRLVSELADLWFHLSVVMVERGVTPEMVAAELVRRRGVSGIEEKRARPQGPG